MDELDLVLGRLEDQAMGARNRTRAHARDRQRQPRLPLDEIREDARRSGGRVFLLA
jgi:hypothetical protein